ncbi:hypothetical protein Tsubulata_027818 [Turnera subulata]|uniref:Myb-like protein L n=1 Tax=Turnera subulata TaxID=218843 RepID=A0A9Q0J993_9ROSI|nr:hypothetical protein Tsubulata_027818 [Turnera subulata]
MSPAHQNDGEEEEHLAGDDEHDEDDDDDVGFDDDDMEALRQACMLTGANIEENIPSLSSPSPAAAAAAASGEAARGSSDGGGSVSGSESEDDLQLFRDIQQQFSIRADSLEQPLQDEEEEEEDDSETLAAVMRRFAVYSDNDNLRYGREKVEPCSENLLVDTTRANEDPNTANFSSGDRDIVPVPDLVEQRDANVLNLSAAELRDSRFPKSAQMFIDAIKKNRSCQKFIRSKLPDIEAKIEQNKRLMESVKTFKNFQAKCKMATGRALSLKQDPYVQLISARRERGNGKRNLIMCTGPEENCHVANYRMALRNFPLSFVQKKWTKEEKESLRKGIVQQFQEMVLQFSMDHISVSEGCSEDANYMDNVLASIKDLDITPEKMREFLPKVNWDQLASLYVPGHSGAECEAQWLNFEDPLINHSPQWTSKEDKSLLYIVQQKGVSNWFDIAASLGTNRTPFKCLERFQRSLNASILKREWTEEEDAQLHAAVEAYGEHNWQSVASTLVGRTGPQCSNRWKKTLNPDRQKVGRWTSDEDKRLRIAVMFFGPKNWDKIAQFVPGRLPPQCRERWVNCLDPSLNRNVWTEEEDLRLKAAIKEYGYRWSMIAKCLAPRTDNQCRRRWKVLAPDEVPLLQAARRMQKVALISNFVDRESERPALGPHDFLPSPMMIEPASEENQSRKHKRRSRRSESEGHAVSGNALKKKRARRCNKQLQVSSEEPLRITDSAEVETLDESHAVVTNGRIEPCSENDKNDTTVLGESNGLKKIRAKRHNKRLQESVEEDPRTTSAGEEVHESSEIRLTNIEDGRSLLDDTSNKQSKPHKVYRRREAITGTHDSSSLSCQQNRSQKSKPKCQTLPEQILEAHDDDDNVTLASLLPNNWKKKHVGTKKAAKGCLPSNTKTGLEVICKKDQSANGPKVPSIMLDGVAGTNNAKRTVTSEMQLRLSKCTLATVATEKPSGADGAKGGLNIVQESDREVGSINAKDDLDTDDIPLLSLFHGREKKRRILAGRGSGTDAVPKPVREPVSISTQCDSIEDITLSSLFNKNTKKRRRVLTEKD